MNARARFSPSILDFRWLELEQALRLNQPFTLDYHPARVPVSIRSGVLAVRQRQDRRASSSITFSPILRCAACTWGFRSSIRRPPSELRKQIPAPRLKLYAHVLDFFGGMFEIRDGKAVVPGGARAEKAWAELAGAAPDKGAAFFEKLLAQDDGWLASYFDALARINGPVKDYLTDPERLKRFYTAIRGRVTSPGPARPVFRSNTDMLLLTTRLRLDADGKPHLPGGLDIWKNLFVNIREASTTPSSRAPRPPGRTPTTCWRRCSA